MRHCGGCTACCKLIPVEELRKPAEHRCVHQRTGKGCAIYERRPVSCREWSCLWLIGSENGGDLPLSRPDRSHYVIDIAPDLVRVRNDETGAIEQELTVMQVWVDRLYPNAWEDSALLDLLERQNVVALIRYGTRRAFALFPPGTTTSGKWERSATNEVSEARDLQEARLSARLDFFRKQFQPGGTPSSEGAASATTEEIPGGR